MNAAQQPPAEARDFALYFQLRVARRGHVAGGTFSLYASSRCLVRQLDVARASAGEQGRSASITSECSLLRSVGRGSE